MSRIYLSIDFKNLILNCLMLNFIPLNDEKQPLKHNIYGSQKCPLGKNLFLKQLKCDISYAYKSFLVNTRLFAVKMFRRLF